MDKIDLKITGYRGIVRGIDALGRVAIPVTFRRELGINNRDEVEILMTTNNEIVIKKHKERDKEVKREEDDI